MVAIMSRGKYVDVITANLWHTWAIIIQNTPMYKQVSFANKKR